MEERRGSNNRWSWDVPGFEPRKLSEDQDDYGRAYVVPPAARRYSMSVSSRSELNKQLVNSKLNGLKEKLKLVREDNLLLRQEALELLEYSSAKLDRVTRYLGVLAEKSRMLDEAVIESEARLSPLISEKRKLFNDLLTAKGNVKVFCRVRPLFEDEGPSVVEFPDNFTLRINTGEDGLSNPKKDFEFDKVYGPHVGQADVFADIQPFVQSAFDGYNVSVFAYGQTGSGKTHTMEGSSTDRGVYFRSFEELFDLSNSDATSSSQYTFYISVLQLSNEKITDLLLESGYNLTKINVGSFDLSIDIVKEKVENPIEFSKILKRLFQSQNFDVLKIKTSHLIVMVHIYYKNLITGENSYSKLSLVDLSGSEATSENQEGGNHETELLHALKSLSVLSDVLACITSEKDEIPYEHSLLTKLLADSIGGSSKTVMLVNICPSVNSVRESLSSLNFSTRARNSDLSLGSRDTIKKWKDVANDARKELLEKEKEISDLKLENLAAKQELKHANDQCVLLFNEAQKAWKVSSTVQSESKSEKMTLFDKLKIEKEQNMQLRSQIAQLLQIEKEQKLQIEQKDSTIHMLQAKLKNVESQLNDSRQSHENRPTLSTASQTTKDSTSTTTQGDVDATVVTKKLENELKKRDALIERLHEENEKLFDRLTDKASSAGSPQVSSPSPIGLSTQYRGPGKNDGTYTQGHAADVPASPAVSEKAGALVKSGNEKIKTPAGEYLTSALSEFDPDQYDSLAAISDGANKLLMLVLAAVIKAGASREHEILAEIRDAVFAFIHKMEPKKVMDTMLVSRVRILYIRSLLARSPELQSIKVYPVERFLEKPHGGRSRETSRSNSPGRSPRNALVEEHIQGFIVNIKQEKKSKLSSVVMKIRGIDQDTWRHHVTGGKLREITEDAKIYAFGNKHLAALFVHTPAGELQRQIRNWLAENFDFLSVAEDSIAGATGQLELLSTAIMDGWMAGLGAAYPPSTDALGQLLSQYTRRVYTSQLQHLKDIAGTLATEAAEDPAQVSKLRSALESVDHKRRKILQQMKSDASVLNLEDGPTSIRNPSTAAEDARLASLIALDGILKQVKDLMRQASVSSLSKSRKRSMLASLDELSEQMPSLLDVDHPCATRHIAEARTLIETASEDPDLSNGLKTTSAPATSGETDVTQWNVLQFNTGSTSPFIIKCGANSRFELVIKADARVQEPKGGEIIRVVPKPALLKNLSLDEIKGVFSELPEALSLLSLARTADGTRARYSRLYRTLAMRVPALKDLVEDT